MEVAVKQQAKLQGDPKQKTTGFILTGVGALLLIVGIVLLRMVDNSTHILLRNFAPLVPLAGLILVGQGLLTLWLRGRRLTAWFMVVPSVAFFLVVGVFPLLYALGLSTVQWDLQNPQRSFIFLGNYATLFTTERVWRSLFNTAIVTAIALIVELIAGIGLARLAMDRFPGRSSFIAIALMPLMMSPIVTGFTWRTLWDARLGAINHFLSLFTGEPVYLPWVNNTELGLLAISITTIWKGIPFVFLISLAAFLAIDTELHEAAAIDGASPWETFWRISLPIIRPVLLVVVVFRTMDILNIVETVLAVTNGGPNFTTETFTFYIFLQGFKYVRFGYGAAASYVLMIISAVISLIYIRRIGEV